MDRSEPKAIVDARGHRCPVPTLRLRRALEALEVGAEIDLIADDPVARIDVPYFAREAGHALLSVEDEGSSVRFRLRKAS